MSSPVTETCPLCAGPATFTQVDLRRKHFKCAVCTEFVLWRAAERRLLTKDRQTHQKLADACRKTTDPSYIYVITGRKDGSPPHVDIEGEAQLRSKALASEQ